MSKTFPHISQHDAPYICKWQDEEGWVSVEQWCKESPDWDKEI